MSALDLPGIHTINLSCLPPNSKDVKKFLANMPLIGCKDLTLALQIRPGDYISNIAPYLKEITRNAHNIEESLTLSNFEISASQIAKLFRASKNLKKLVFDGCKLSFSGVPDFSKALKGTSLKTLGLPG